MELHEDAALPALKTGGKDLLRSTSFHSNGHQDHRNGGEADSLKTVDSTAPGKYNNSATRAGLRDVDDQGSHDEVIATESDALLPPLLCSSPLNNRYDSFSNSLPRVKENGRGKTVRLCAPPEDDGDASLFGRHEGGTSEGGSETPPPDGGYGWVVVFASFMVNMIADGVSFSFGLLFVDLSDYFDSGKSKTAWIGSLYLSMPLLAGPIASALTDRFGCRRICIIGSLLATAGFALSFFVDTIEVLFLTFSLAGFGLALCYVTSIVIVAYYFERRRSLATGLAVCGTGVGTFVFPPLTSVWLDAYGWRGTLLLLSGVFLNMCVFGALMRDLDDYGSGWSRSSSSDASSSKERRLRTMLKVLFGSTENCAPPIGFYSASRPNFMRQSSHRSFSRGSISDFNFDMEREQRLCSSLVQLPTYITDGRLPIEVLSEISSKEGGHLSNLIDTYPNLWQNILYSRTRGDSFSAAVKSSPQVAIKQIINPDGNPAQQQLTTTTSPNNPAAAAVSNTGATPAVNNVASGSTPMVSSATTAPNAAVVTKEGSVVKQEVEVGCFFFSKTPGGALQNNHHNNLLWERPLRQRIESAYLRNLRLQRGSLTYRGAMLNIRRYRLKASSCPDIYRNSMTTINEKSFMDEIVEVLADMIDVRLFRNIPYAFFCISNFMLNVSVDNPYVYLPDNAISQGIGKDAASFLISILGILNTLGVVIMGYLGDKPWLDASLLYAICTAIAGIALGLVPFFSTYSLMAVSSAVYGFTISANYTLVPVIVVNLISIDSFTAAYGLLLMVQGIAGLVGPPLAGWLFDASGTYAATFYLSGVTILLSAAIVLPIVKSWRCGNRRARPNPNDRIDDEEHNVCARDNNNCRGSSPAAVHI